ncbi:MAG: DegT/DnrJ/EryC1/StrS family aminotransferase [Syntrophobacteraceae bacterium]|nr:DegT/DnrJ/EryC1/StrS family aminotransferase [Syntrophobacteraceae bacterium]
MQFIDLEIQQKRIRTALDTRIREVLKHGQYIMGPEVARLEEALSRYTGTAHAVACSSGTDALLMALMAHEVSPGDAVFTTPFTFMATAEVISLLGATPVFVDIDPGTFNLDPDHLEHALDALAHGNPKQYPLPRTSAARALNPRGVIAVDLYGLPADYDRINALADKHGLFVLQDAAQSFGARRNGKMACAMATIGCTSFFPAKPLGGYGDGGMCFTDDPDLAQKLRSLRVHGQGSHKYENVRIGLNGRLDTLQAAILLAKFDVFPEELTLRQTVAGRYEDLLSGGGSPVVPPRIPGDCVSAWAQYTVVSREEDGRPTLQERLKKAGIPTAVYYPTPLHLQPAYAHLGYKPGDFPSSEDRARRVLSLPMHPYLSWEDQQTIAGAILG